GVARAPPSRETFPLTPPTRQSTPASDLLHSKKRGRTGRPTEQAIDIVPAEGRLPNAIVFRRSLQSERFIPNNVLGVEDSAAKHVRLLPARTKIKSRNYGGGDRTRTFKPLRASVFKTAS